MSEGQNVRFNINEIDIQKTDHLSSVNMIEMNVTSMTEDLEFSLLERVGVLFQCPSDMALIHGVSQDCHISVGIERNFEFNFLP